MLPRLGRFEASTRPIHRIEPEGTTLDATATAGHQQAPAPIKGRDWITRLQTYREPDPARSWFEIGVTALPFAALWLAAWALIDVSYWLTLALTVPAALLLVRLFLIQHDCGHGAFFRNRAANDWTGRILGVFTLTPYDVWQRNHAIHHASSGNLDRRGTGDIDTKTVEEYLALAAWGRFMYRLYRNPIVMFVIGPAYLFILQHRIPIGQMTAGIHPWISALATNLASAAIIVGMLWLVGLKSFLMVHLPIVMLAASLGVWLFYVQHQFEDAFWEKEPTWDIHDAALYGSSHYDLPGVLRWFTANIGVHHVHHLYARIPFYRLGQVLRDYPELASIRRLTLMESFHCVPLVLWDESQRRLVTFREARQMAKAKKR